ncbi:hypothetical protein VTO73DRAFT_44 [Trametes versicolor]
MATRPQPCGMSPMSPSTQHGGLGKGLRQLEGEPHVFLSRPRTPLTTGPRDLGLGSLPARDPFARDPGPHQAQLRSDMAADTSSRQRTPCISRTHWWRYRADITSAPVRSRDMRTRAGCLSYTPKAQAHVRALFGLIARRTRLRGTAAIRSAHSRMRAPSGEHPGISPTMLLLSARTLSTRDFSRTRTAAIMACLTAPFEQDALASVRDAHIMRMASFYQQHKARGTVTSAGP